MKKVLVLCLAMLAIVLLFSACGGESLSDEDFIGTWEEPRDRFRVIIRADGTGEQQTQRGYFRFGAFIPSGEYTTIVGFDWERRGNNLVVVPEHADEDWDYRGGEFLVSINNGVMRFGSALTEYRRASLTY